VRNRVSLIGLIVRLLKEFTRDPEAENHFPPVWYRPRHRIRLGLAPCSVLLEINLCFKSSSKRYPIR
jgi:hypothetical protein